MAEAGVQGVRCYLSGGRGFEHRSSGAKARFCFGFFGTAKAVPFPILHDRKLCAIAARRENAGATISARVFQPVSRAFTDAARRYSLVRDG
jgi:hypothetical protein